jgi:hypothetical protein
MKDAFLARQKTLPNAGGGNFTDSLDLNPMLSGYTFNASNTWRLPRLQATIPALVDHTNASANVTIRLQDSADNGNWADTSPRVEIVIPGTPITGTAAQRPFLAFPPGVRRYVRFSQTVDANGGTGNNSIITYDLDL